MRISKLFTVSVAVFLCGWVQAEQPNIVVILVDDLGYGDAGAFNPQSKVATPNIDGLAAARSR